MGNDVFANGREISCKAADGKAICAFPDVCFTPPQTPATPPGVPIPYPNTGMASDATNGSKKVKISNKEVMLKNKSYFKKSSGDEAGSAPKKGVVTSKIQGKVYFNAWSIDVKFEGENVVRHFDLTTHNHSSPPANSPPWLYVDTMAAGGIDDAGKCATTAKQVEDNCTNTTFRNDKSTACCEAKKCVLAPYGSQPECCEPPKRTKHHAVPDHCFKAPGEKGQYYKGFEKMSHSKGLCICVEGKDKNETTKQHSMIHKDFDPIEDEHYPIWKFGTAKKEAAKACAKHSGCDKECLEQQITGYHNEKGINDDANLRADSAGRRDPPDPSKMGSNTATQDTGAGL
jgi:hypothetical protein